MKIINNGINLLNELVGVNSILDASVENINISSEDDLTIKIIFRMRKDCNYKRVILVFKEIIEYGFYFNNKHIFYYVESFKLIHTANNNYYISLDPYEQTINMSENDQDFILCKYIVGYSID